MCFRGLTCEGVFFLKGSHFVGGLKGTIRIEAILGGLNPYKSLFRVSCLFLAFRGSMSLCPNLLYGKDMTQKRASETCIPHVFCKKYANFADLYFTANFIEKQP